MTGAPALDYGTFIERKTQLDGDHGHGTLYRLPLEGDEPLVMVRVENSTLEPDGSRKPYWLRVPPDMDTAAGAVAWGFGMGAGEYRVGQAS